MAISVFTASLTSGQTQPTDGMDLGAFGWNKIVMVIPSCPSGDVGMTVCDTLAGDYVPLSDTPSAYTSPIANYLRIDSTVVSGGVAALFPGGFQYVKPHNTSGVTNTPTTYKLICST